MKNREIFMGGILLIFTICLFIIANSYDQRKASEKRQLEEQKKQEEVALSKPKYYDNERIIIIGDSRMYGASKVVKDDDIIFVARNGARCNYLWNVAEKEVDHLLAENPEEHFSIVFNLGVNDLDSVAQGKEATGETICNVNQYAEYYKKLKEKWSEHNFFFISVNPVDEKVLKTGKFRKTKMTNNDKIKEFNEDLMKELEKENFYYCDTYTKMMKDGFGSPDGLHYSDDSSKEIIAMIKECNEETKKEQMKTKYLLLNFFQNVKRKIGVA